MKGKKQLFLILSLILLIGAYGCGKNKPGQTDEQRTREDVQKNINIILQLDRWVENDGEKVAEGTKAEDFSKIFSARNTRIFQDIYAKESVAKLQQYSADLFNRSLVYDSLAVKTHSSFTRLALLESLKRTPFRDKDFKEHFFTMLSDESEDPFLKYRVITILVENNLSESIPYFLREFSKHNVLLEDQLAFGISNFKSKSLTLILRDMEDLEINGVKNNTLDKETNFKALGDLAIRSYEKNNIRNITHDPLWAEALHNKYPLEASTYCQFQDMALDIVVHFHNDQDQPLYHIETALAENRCPGNKTKLEQSLKILELL